jgi:TRAP-type uncharacterized transport system fused permease subunit
MADEKNEKLAEDVLKKYDKESNAAAHKGLLAKFVSALAIAFSVFQLYTAVFGVLDAQLQRAVHLGFGLALVFMLFPTRKSMGLSFILRIIFLRFWERLHRRIFSLNISSSYCAQAQLQRWILLSVPWDFCLLLRQRAVW